MKRIKTFENFRDFNRAWDEFSVGEIYFTEPYLKTDPNGIYVLSKKPTNEDLRYWAWNIGFKDDNGIHFYPVESIKEVDLYSPRFIIPTRKEKQEIEDYIKSNLQDKI